MTYLDVTATAQQEIRNGGGTLILVKRSFYVYATLHTNTTHTRIKRMQHKFTNLFNNQKQKNAIDGTFQNLYPIQSMYFDNLPKNYASHCSALSTWAPEKV